MLTRNKRAELRRTSFPHRCNRGIYIPTPKSAPPKGVIAVRSSLSGASATPCPPVVPVLQASKHLKTKRRPGGKIRGRTHIERLLQGLQVTRPQLGALVVRKRPAVQHENALEGVLSPCRPAVVDPLLPQLGAEREPLGKAGSAVSPRKTEGARGGVDVTWCVRGGTPHP